ncbi:SDR family NAD(P)-dependent oxidoreductase [Lutispora saccharofermentans]|uniref:SDR family NAD(P)-dependent oxidoreductase n=1 Tax=Lutispora saccharofermentans TaxID=3024236 RepID=A0ABT1NJ72_9FIRM|nr:SDR family NAD(P)-dependent oxidoreductase [Lutispora saccharofermentans]MCQ1531114.1 SDR family NAD(P)-dependent oxidoreductase [Lutispora saccharofermentans]
MGQISFQGQVAIVTGAGQGLGKSYAKLMASRGAKVIINDIAKDAENNPISVKVAEEINALGGIAVANHDSISTMDGAASLKNAALKHFGKIDILVHNAGILISKPLNETDELDWIRVSEVHLNGAFYLIKEICPVMVRNNYGRIVLITSSTGMFGLSNHIIYSAAKMGVFGLALSLNEEMKDKNILCNLISPLAGTNQTSSALNGNMFDMFEPELVAPMTVYLCSSECTSGGTVYVAGGGYFSRIGLFEGDGVFIGNDSISIEEIANSIKDITSLDGAVHIASMKSAAKKLLKKVIRNR